MFVISRAADEGVCHVKGQIALGTEPVDDAGHLTHDFGADAVTGKDKKGWVGHGTLLEKICLAGRSAMGRKGQEHLAREVNPDEGMAAGIGVCRDDLRRRHSPVCGGQNIVHTHWPGWAEGDGRLHW